MSKHFFILLTVLFITGTAFAQQTINAFIPKGYDTLVTVTGDLNKDGLNDMVLVLASTLEEDSVAAFSDSLPARLLIVLMNNGKGYTMSAKASGAILCKQCGGVFGDPLSGIEIKNGILIVGHYGGSSWRWALTHKYRYQENDFYLIGKTNYSYWNVEMCNKLGEYAGTDYKDENLVTGDFAEKKVSQEGCKMLVNKKGKQAVKPLIKLTEVNIEN